MICAHGKCKKLQEKHLQNVDDHENWRLCPGERGERRQFWTWNLQERHEGGALQPDTQFFSRYARLDGSNLNSRLSLTSCLWNSPVFQNLADGTSTHLTQFLTRKLGGALSFPFPLSSYVGSRTLSVWGCLLRAPECSLPRTELSLRLLLILCLPLILILFLR